MKKNKTKLSIFLLSIWLMTAGAWAQPVLVKDIRKDSLSVNGIAVKFGSKLLISADDGIHGAELWLSDGTTGGTKMIKDIWPGTSKRGVESFFMSFDGNYYFQGNDSLRGREIWRTDGTPDGTVLFHDGCPGTCNNTNWIIPYKNKLYFTAQTPTTGAELYFSDGSISSNQLFKDIRTGTLGSSPSRFSIFKDNLYFSAQGTTLGIEPYITDGTPEGTKIFVDIFKGGTNGSAPSRFVIAGDYAFFYARTLDQANELWKTDGTETGTKMVKDINPGAGWAYPLSQINALTWGDKLYFVAETDSTGAELWITDGTENNTKMLTEIGPGKNGGFSSFYGIINDKLLFLGSPIFGISDELWVTDGTPQGTQKINGFFEPGGAKIVYQDKLIFTAHSFEEGSEMWITDGTEKNTKIFHSMWEGNKGSDPHGYTILDDKLYFFANSPTGSGLWKLDLSSVSTHEPQAAELLRIMPTITSDGQFYVQMTELARSSGGLDLRIVNAQGQVLGQSTINESGPLDLSRLPTGLYFVQVLTKDLQYRAVQKIITH